MTPEVNNNPLAFASAYRQLRPAARVFVDRYIGDVEREAQRTNRVIPLPIEGYSQRDQTLMCEPLVQAAIAERMRDLVDAMELNARKVIKEVSGIAFSNINNYMVIGEDGQPYFDLARCTPEMLGAIKTIKIEETVGQNGGKRKFEFVLHDKLAGLSMLFKYMGLDSGDNPHWQAEKARNTPVDGKPAAVTQTMSEETTADLYARTLNA